MKEHGIIFQGWSVRAILEGRKTQTRRAVKPQPENVENRTSAELTAAWQQGFVKVRCPYGLPGDRLWVRETWGLPPRYDPEKHGNLKTKPSIGPIAYGEQYGGADGERRQAWEKMRWRSSIHMPRWASRITLSLVGVRVERVQDISEEDARAEGLFSWADKEGRIYYGMRLADVWEQDPRRTFERVWDAINAKRGFGWDANPWVWVLQWEPVAS